MCDRTVVIDDRKKLKRFTLDDVMAHMVKLGFVEDVGNVVLDYMGNSTFCTNLHSHLFWSRRILTLSQNVIDLHLIKSNPIMRSKISQTSSLFRRLLVFLLMNSATRNKLGGIVYDIAHGTCEILQEHTPFGRRVKWRGYTLYTCPYVRPTNLSDVLNIIHEISRFITEFTLAIAHMDSDNVLDVRKVLGSIKKVNASLVDDILKACI